MKKLLIAVVVLAAAAGGGLAYAWKRATAVPAWYAADTAVPDAAVSVPAISVDDLLAQRTVPVQQAMPAPADAAVTAPASEPAPSNQSVQVTLSEADLDQIATSVASSSTAASLLDAAGDINTRIDRDRIESGTVVNLSELPLEALPAQGQTAIRQLQERFPRLANREVYIGLAGQPQVTNGQLTLGDGATLQIGQMSIPLSEAARQAGLSQAELEAQLSRLLTRQGISLESVQLVEGQLQLQGQAQ